MLGTPRGSSTDARASGEATGGRGRESVIPSVASNTHHTLTAASADSRAGGGRRWDSGLDQSLPSSLSCNLVMIIAGWCIRNIEVPNNFLVVLSSRKISAPF